MFFTGLIIALSTFVIIGIFHPIVIKTEYYFGTKPWFVFLIVGLGFIVLSMFTCQIVLSVIFGVIGACCLWSIGELFAQRRRVERGWFPKRGNNKGKEVADEV